MGKIKTHGDNGNSKELDRGEIIRLQGAIMKRKNQINELKPGDKIRFSVMPTHYGTVNLGIYECEAVILKKYPRFLLLDFGKYRICASIIALAKNELITI